MTITVNRRDITLVEQVLYRQEGFFDNAVRTPLSSTWVATLGGSLSTGEHVEMTRSANTSSEALANLEAAIAENDWEIQ